MNQSRHSSKEQRRLKGLVVRIHNTSVQEATCAKEKSSSQKGTEWHTHDKDIKTKVVFHKTKTTKRSSGIGLNMQHRKVFGLLDTQGVWGVFSNHTDMEEYSQE